MIDNQLRKDSFCRAVLKLVDGRSDKCQAHVQHIASSKKHTDERYEAFPRE